MRKTATRTRSSKGYGRPDLRRLMADVMDGGLEFFEAEPLEGERRMAYASMAKLIIDSEIFRNEMKRLKDLAMRTAVMRAANFEQVQDMQMTVAAMEIIEQRFKDIAEWVNPKKPEAEDPHAPI